MNQLQNEKVYQSPPPWKAADPRRIPLKGMPRGWGMIPRFG